MAARGDALLRARRSDPSGAQRRRGPALERVRAAAPATPGAAARHPGRATAAGIGPQTIATDEHRSTQTNSTDDLCWSVLVCVGLCWSALVCVGLCWSVLVC